jgi:hypothetical protein
VVVIVGETHADTEGTTAGRVVAHHLVEACTLRIARAVVALLLVIVIDRSRTAARGVPAERVREEPRTKLVGRRGHGTTAGDTGRQAAVEEDAATTAATETECHGLGDAAVVHLLVVD